MTTSTAKQIIDTPAFEELTKDFLEYSMSVVYSRALPGIDGLKPVQRRLIFANYTIDKILPSGGYVKSAQPVSTCMGKFHPHGDSSIYQAMVKMAQPFYLNMPYYDGYGNWGDVSGSDAAASRYTEVKLHKNALLMVSEVGENTVDMRDNYSGELLEPAYSLPVQVPALLINGAFGIGVGFANNSAPHNSDEVMNATKHMLRHPNATLDEVMKYMPGPDFPTGALVIGQDGIRQAFETGRGIFRIRARATVKATTKGKHEIVFNELPYEIGTDTIIEQIKKGLKEGKFAGLYDAKDLTDRRNGLRVVIETKSGVNPQIVLNELYSNTNLEISYGVNNTILVKGEPKTIGLLETIQLFIDLRREVITRRSEFRKAKREERLHLVVGLLKALANIDEVIKIVRNSDNAQIASEGLQKKFKIDEIQSAYILEIPLRRLTKLDQIELETEKKKLEDEIAELNKILNDPKVLDDVIYKELNEVQKAVSQPRRSEIIGGTLAEHLVAAKEVAATAAESLEIPDEPTFISITPKWGIVRAKDAPTIKKPMRATVGTTTRSKFVVVTSAGRGFKVDAIHIGEKEQKLADVLPTRLEKNEQIVAVVPFQLEEGKTGGIAIGTRQGVVKITRPEWPKTMDEFSVISLTKDDYIVGASWVPDVKEYDFAFIANDSSFLTFPAEKASVQGLSAAGVAGMSLKGNHIVSFSVVEKAKRAEYVVVETTGKTIKATPFMEDLYPSKGRATGGFSSYNFQSRLGESEVVASAVSFAGVLFTEQGQLVKLPLALNPKRVASGEKLENEGLF